MVKCLAWEFGPKQITVNVVAPGGIKTDMYTENAARYIPGGSQMDEAEIDAQHSMRSPLGRPGYPGNVAGIVSLLCSDEAIWITGQVLYVTGGAYMAS